MCSKASRLKGEEAGETDQASVWPLGRSSGKSLDWKGLSATWLQFLRDPSGSQSLPGPQEGGMGLRRPRRGGLIVCPVCSSPNLQTCLPTCRLDPTKWTAGTSAEARVTGSPRPHVCPSRYPPISVNTQAKDLRVTLPLLLSPSIPDPSVNPFGCTFTI